ncbi:MAG: outer membrane protein transport protein [Acidobacteria bacterium]|nr:outer membrane protein transport protein [Acidobacteriota bacterium]MBI3488986.1 outer membrane protein transport protein [Acidobacteriota bacterium]
MAEVVRGVIRVGLALGVCALPAAAQSMALPASDPVGIARGGAQVAFGYSLEAAATNPSLLASLKEKGGFYLAAGLETSSFQESLESDQKSRYSMDRNRAIGAFGFAARMASGWTLGLKVDEPYLRHGRLPDDAPSRYLGDGIDLSAKRMEVQAAWALNPNISVGLGVGVARLSYESSSVMRLNVPNDAALPGSGSNAVNGLVEQRVGQSGNKVVPSYSLGARWALNPRWTLGFAHQSGLKGAPNMKAGLRDSALGAYANDGLSAPPLGTSARVATLLAASLATPGQGNLELPSQTTFGVRHRLSPMVTWEADLRWTSGGLQAPSFASIQTPSGTVSTPWELPRGKSHLGVFVSAEVEMGKFWTLRGGLSLDQRSVQENVTEPLLGGARTAAFSVGLGHKMWGGELNLGYQYRQSEDQDTSRLNGVWSSAGYRSVGTRQRLEGMGHLMALGYKKTF